MTEPAPPRVADPAAGPRASRSRPLWLLFGGLAAVIVIVDQLTKAWLVGRVQPGESIDLVDGYLRLIHARNTGALFGMFRDQAPLFALLSVGVVALIVWYHGRGGRSPYLSVTLGLLLGGAIGNFTDRVHYGYVVDFVDGGIGTVRWYTFNVADAAISAALLLLVLLALRPSLATPAAGPPNGTADA